MFYNIAKQKTCLEVSVEAMTSIITLSHTSKSTKTPIHNSLKKKYIYIHIVNFCTYCESLLRQADAKINSNTFTLEFLPSSEQRTVGQAYQGMEISDIQAEA